MRASLALIGLLAMVVSRATAEPAVFHFINTYTGDSVTFNLTTSSPSSSNVLIGNIAFGMTHQPLNLASGTLGAAQIYTTSANKYLCTIPVETAPSLGPNFANIATCLGSSVLSCSDEYPQGQYGDTAFTTVRVLHASLSERSKTINFQWQAGTFFPTSLANATFGTCSSWITANIEDWNSNSTLMATIVSHGSQETVKTLQDFYSQPGAVVTFVLADDEHGHLQILPMFEGFTQSPVPPPAARGGKVKEVEANYIPRE